MAGDAELLNMVEKLRYDEDPVVLIVFTDHMPWMGDSNVYYQEMGVYLDLGTEQGVRNYFTTDYLIWANDAAKEALGTDFAGKGPTVSPCYLMDVAFEQMGWAGPAFSQVMREMREVFPVISTHHSCYVIDDVFTDTIPEHRQQMWHKFQCLQHYWRNEFLYQ